MELEFSGRKIFLKRELSQLDRFVLEFVSILEKSGVRYAIVSGYVALVFGRSRNTEDVDLIVERLDDAKFQSLWEKLREKFDCINAPSASEAFERYLQAGLAIRFCKAEKFIPNMEFKFEKSFYDSYAIKNPTELALNGSTVKISPLELQIAYKMALNSEKDLEDARFLYRLFKEHLDAKSLARWVSELRVSEKSTKFVFGEIP